LMITDDEKANLKRDIGDIARLHDRKKSAIDEFNDMRKSPFAHNDDVKESVVATLLLP